MSDWYKKFKDSFNFIESSKVKIAEIEELLQRLSLDSDSSNYNFNLNGRVYKKCLPKVGLVAILNKNKELIQKSIDKELDRPIVY